MIIEAGALVWGEPYAEAGPSQSLASVLGRALTTSTSSRLFVDSSTQPGEALWLRNEPNLYPPLEDFVDAQRAWFRRLLAEPASRLGFGRWGMRETRLDADDATYLRLLFPRARIVFLYRNPYDAWASLRRTGWVVSTPDDVITTAAQFGRHWRDRVEGFLSSAEQLDAHLVSYESLCGDAATRVVLADYLGLQFKDEALDHHTWSSAGTLPRRDVAALAKAAGPIAAHLGYRGPTTLRGSTPDQAGS